MILVFKELKDFFVLVYDESTNDDGDSHGKKFLPRVNIENYTNEINRDIFYTQPIKYPIKKYNKIGKLQHKKGMITQEYVY